ncbi:MAG: ZIP family metal transporter [Thermoleophilia bacterium]|nr:ZIP family metal transporter [Thermoleophilia bacterium]
MTFAETILLAAIAGGTIVVGLPLARMKMSGRTRVMIAMFSVGILAFLLIDVLGHGYEGAEGAVEAFGEDEGSLGHAVALTALLLGGFTLGSFGIGLLERRIRSARPNRLPPIAGGATDTLTVEESQRLDLRIDESAKQALRTGLFIAAAIGLHNFAEGLAIGVSAGTGEIALATVLVIGFALHNATEGFGIIGPLGDVRPSWRWLGLAGLIAGLPVVIGASIGYSVDSEALEIAFFGLAGGAILFVIGEVWHGVRRYGHKELGLLMLAAGFSAGILTDFVIAYAGG